LLSDQDTGDLFSIATTTHGATTLTTTDDDATAAHFEIAADGDIILDAANDIYLEAGGADFYVDARNYMFTSSTSGRPLLTLETTNTQANTSAELKFLKDAADTGDGEYLGSIGWYGDNDAGTPEEIQYGQILVRTADVSDGTERGNMYLKVAEYDGNLSVGLQLSGTDTNGEIDASIGAGAASVTTIAGTLTMGSTAAMDNSGLLTVANQTGITGTGTVTSGTWNSAGTITTASQPNFTTLAGLTSFGSAGATTDIAAGDLTMYNAVNDGNPTVRIGSSATNNFEIKPVYNSGAQTIDSVDFTTYTTSSSSNDGRYRFFVDEVELARILDGQMFINGSFNAKGDGAYLQTKSETTSSATEGGKLRLICDDGAAMGNDHRLGVVQFEGAEDASQNFTIGAQIEAFCEAAWSASENGGRMVFSTTDGNASTSEVLRLDSNKLSTFSGAVDISPANNVGTPALLVDNDDTDQVAVKIEAANVDATALAVLVPDLTTGHGINVNADSLTTGAALRLDVDTALTTTNTMNIMTIDFDKSGNMASGQSHGITGINLDMTDNATSNVGNTIMTGIFIDMDHANTNGVTYQAGVSVDLNGADAGAMYGFTSDVPDTGGVDFKAFSSANSADYFQIATSTNGATTLTTVDGDAALAHFEIAADGNITLDAAGDIALEAGGNDVTVDTDNFIIESATNHLPKLEIKSTYDGGDGGNLNFHKDRASTVVNDDVIGTISWQGDNDADESITYGYIEVSALEVDDTDEAGRMKLQVAESNGAATTVTTGLEIFGADNTTDGEVDVTIAAGAASTTTIAGTLTMGSTATLDNSGILQVAAQANITSVGTLTGLTTSGAIELGHADDTTIARSAAGKVTIEGNQVVTAGAVNVSSGSQSPIAMQVARRTITTGEANTMFTGGLSYAPIELIPAQGANTIIMPTSCMAKVDRAANQTNGSTTMDVHYDGQTGGYGSSSLFHFRRFGFGETTDYVERRAINQVTSGLTLTEDVNKAVEISFNGGAPTTDCFTSIDIFITYYVLDIS